MVSSISNNLSALNAFGTGLDVKANNIANINSENYKKSQAFNTEGENGGVKTEIRKVDTDSVIPSPVSTENISGPQPSNVDLAEEIPGVMIDEKGYQANLKFIQTREELLGSVLDIIA